jgi:hypothetical protein
LILKTEHHVKVDVLHAVSALNVASVLNARSAANAAIVTVLKLLLAWPQPVW